MPVAAGISGRGRRVLEVPRVTGSAVVGQKLAASHGRWSGRPTRYSYSWLGCDSRGGHCRVVAGAHGARHLIRRADSGHRLRVRVTAHWGRRTASARSAPTRVVRALSLAPGGPEPVAGSLRVEGNRLIGRGGAPVQLHGVNRSGSEYACVQGWGMFDGPSDDRSIAAMRAWNANAVRVLLNEDCWLGINGVKDAYSGATYRKAIVDYVRRIEAHGMYAEVALIWAAPGSYRATYQPASPDADHSPDVWRGMADAFKGEPGVLLAPWGETIVNADCFLHGGTCEATYGPSNTPYRTAGMQEAVDVMRAEGWTGPIVIPGIDSANDMTKWLSHEPHDPLGQIVAESHVYGKQVCSTAACFDRNYAPVAARVPMIFGETGESFDDSSCGASDVTGFMDWADAHGVGYLPWTWDTWGTCGALITSYDGTPKGEYGRAVRAHLLTRR
ncbi:MAG: cellulase family glycosylhydrolase [Solirubrobacteraceae bacterium]